MIAHRFRDLRAHRDGSEELKDCREHDGLAHRDGFRADRGGVRVGDVIRTDAVGCEEGEDARAHNDPRIFVNLVASLDPVERAQNCENRHAAGTRADGEDHG